MVEESAGGTTVCYIREPGGELIARVHPTQGIRYYHFDELGSTRLLTDANGTVTDRYAYDAYGSLLSHDRYTGSVNQPYQYVGRLGYHTHWMEPEFSLLQLGVRFYDAKVGRFGQRDPERYGPSPYNYSLDEPLVITDASGRIPVIVIRCIASPLCRSAVGCIAAALGKGAWSVFNDVINNRRIDWKRAGRHAVCGCIAGALLFNAFHEPGVAPLDPIMKSLFGTTLTAFKKTCEALVDCGSADGRRDG